MCHLKRELNGPMSSILVKGVKTFIGIILEQFRAISLLQCLLLWLNFKHFKVSKSMRGYVSFSNALLILVALLKLLAMVLGF